MWQKLGQLRARLPVFGKLELWSKQCRTGVDEGGSIAFDEFRGRQFAIPFDQFGLVIKQLQMARSAGHEQEDHALGFGWKMRLLGRERVIGRGRGSPTVLPK